MNKSRVFYEVPELSEQLRKVNFPNVPPPTLKQIKAAKGKPKPIVIESKTKKKK